MFKAIASFVAISIIVSSAHASDFNVDFGSASPIPASTYGAAANSAGFWNVYVGGAQGGLQDLSSAVTGVSITQTGSGIPSGFNDPLTTGNDEALLDDYLAIPFIDHYVFSGLSAGTYNVYSYTWTFGPLSTGIIVNGSSQQIIGGTWSGSFVQGSNYAFNTVTIGTNQPIDIEVDSINGALGAISGVQIVQQVPEPASAGLGLLAMTLVFLGTRKAKSFATP